MIILKSTLEKFITYFLAESYTHFVGLRFQIQISQLIQTVKMVVVISH